MTSFALSPPQHVLDDALRADTGMVATGHEEGAEAAHAVPANQQVLEGSAEGMTTVQRAGDIRRGDWDDKRSRSELLALGREFWLEETLLLPPSIPSGLDSGGVVSRVVGGLEITKNFLFAGGSLLDKGGEGVGLFGVESVLIASIRTSEDGLTFFFSVAFLLALAAS